MLRALHGDTNPDAMDDYAAAMLAPDSAEIPFVAECEDGSLAAFAYAGVRSYAEGCKDGPAAYLEGIWVAPEHRRTGIARALVSAVEHWADGRGLGWLASDALLENIRSQDWHEAVGFEEVERSVHYRKRIGPELQGRD